MNFSLEINKENALDVFSFFSVANAVSCPPELWFECVCSSLKNKHSVLILETPLAQFPQPDFSKRWQTGDNWSWLSPRGLSVFTDAYTNKPVKYEDFKIFLSNSK